MYSILVNLVMKNNQFAKSQISTIAWKSDTHNTIAWDTNIY